VTTYTLDMTPAEAVANGAQLLDERLPGWWRQISLSELILADCQHCVCGQLAVNAAVATTIGPWYFTAYGKTLQFLELSWEYGDNQKEWEYDYNHGFNVKSYDWFRSIMTEDEYEQVSSVTYLLLENEWRAAIKARLEADALQAHPSERLPELVC